MIIQNTFEFLTTGYGEKVKLSKEDLLKRLENLKEDCISEIDEFILALEQDDEDGQYDACCDLLTFASNMPVHAGLDLDKLLAYGEMVHASNMTKFCDTYEEAVETKMAYANGTHPNKPGEFIEVEIYKTVNVKKPYMVRLPNGGKIMKSVKFKDTLEM